MTATATSGPLVAPAPVDLLTGRADEVAAWLAYEGLAGRYATTGAGPTPQWWRHSGGRWRPSDVRVVRAAVRYALDDAYRRLSSAEGVSLRRLDWLLAPDGAERSVWAAFARRVRTDRARLGLA